jgi:hypothetical protein
VLLDTERNVVDAYSIEPETDIDAMIGSSYAAIEFKGSETSRHKVLILYRTDNNLPLGKKDVEIAFDLQQNNEFTGWLIFTFIWQLEMKRSRRISARVKNSSPASSP